MSNAIQKILVGFIIICSGGFIVELLYRMKIMSSVLSFFVFLGGIIILSMICYAVGDTFMGMMDELVKRKVENERKKV